MKLLNQIYHYMVIIEFDHIKYVLNDFTGIDKFEMTKYGVISIATIDDVAAISKPVLKIAIVTIDELLLSWVHTYCDEMKNSPYECKIFETLDDGRKWIAS